MGKDHLIDITRAVGATYLGVSKHANVIEVVNQDGWCIRGKRSFQFHALHVSIMVTEVPQTEKGSDIVLWKHGDKDYRHNFPTAIT